MKKETLYLKAEDVAGIIDSILYGYDEGFENALEYGFSEIEKFSEALRESDKTFVINKIEF